MKRDSILASVTGLFDSSTWAGKQGGAPRASLPPADTPPMPHACSKTMSFPNPSLNTFTERLVLVAEDEPGIVGVLEAYLRRDGFRTCSAMDGVEAMRLFRELRPDAVLLDVNLPGMDGLDVLRAIRDEGQTPSSSSRRWPMTSTSCLGCAWRGRLRRQTLQSRRGRGAPAGVLRRAGRMRTPRPSASAASRSTSRTTSRSRTWAAGAPCRCN